MLGSDYTGRSQGRSEEEVMSGGWRVDEQLLLKHELVLTTMLNKLGYFALGIIQKEKQKKGGNDRIWLSRKTFSGTHSST